MKKRGFTLIELLTVVVILGVVGLVVIPSVTTAIKNSKNDLFQSQVESIKNAARSWAASNTDSIPVNHGDTVSITMGQLKQQGFLELDIRDPRNNKKLSNLNFITITKDQNSFHYQIDADHILYQENSGYQENAPMLLLNGNALEYIEITPGNDLYQDTGVIAKTSNGVLIPESNITKLYQHGDTEISGIPTNLFDTYTVTYSAVDQGLTSSITRTVIIRDTTPPILNTLENINISVSEVAGYDLKTGVTYSDNDTNGKMTLHIQSTLSNVVGKYLITYTVTDESGNKATKRRFINVTA